MDACTTRNATVAGTRSRRFKFRVAVVARRWWVTYWEHQARRATFVILCSLDERTLRDIGINPSEIQSCIWASSDRRRGYDRNWPWRSTRRYD